MNPIPLAGKFFNNPLIRSAFNEAGKGLVSQGVSAGSRDPVNKFAGFMFGMPYATIPATAILGINAGATAPGTLDEARRMGLYQGR